MRISPAQLAEMPTEKVVEVCQGNYMNMVALAVADALHGATRAETRRWLRSQETHLDWLDALRSAETAAQIAAERAEYERTGEGPRHAEQRARIAEVIAEAEALRRKYDLEAHRETIGHEVESSASLTARSWLVKYHKDEFFEDFYEPLLRKAGLAEARRDYDSKDALDGVEKAYGRGYLAALRLPSEKSAKFLLEDGAAQFKDAVADDVRISQGRIEGLRHPLVLRRWRKALGELVTETAPHAGLSQPHSVDRLDMGALRLMPAGRAGKLLNQRRLYLGLRQRQREWEMVLRRYCVAEDAAAKQAKEQYRPVREEAVEALVQAYVLQYAHIHARVVGELGFEDGETLVTGGKPTLIRRSKLRSAVFAELDEMGL